MLETIFIVLLILWALGVFTVTSQAIHLLLVLALVLLILRLLKLA